jgi:hypothetical protein
MSPNPNASTPPTAALPLAGLRVIDMATIIAAPFCATLLGEFGADVLKIEHPEGGDGLRRFGTPSARGDTLTWMSEGRNKRSMTLDLRQREGVEIFKGLIAQTDVVCENFRTGTLTVCTMVPMRSVPHRVVCLVGLDDNVFPRIGVVDGDDVLARDPMTGERDVRSEDRQLLLDAIAATVDTLVITYTGANDYTGQPRPPAVPLAELLDALDAVYRGERYRVSPWLRRHAAAAA